MVLSLGVGHQNVTKNHIFDAKHHKTIFLAKAEWKKDTICSNYETIFFGKERMEKRDNMC